MTVKFMLSTNKSLNLEFWHISQMGQIQRSFQYWVSVSFNSLFKVLFNFPSQYLFAIGHVSEYLALDGTYHPLRAVLPNSSTQPSTSSTHPLTYGYRSITFFGMAFQSQISPLFQSMHNAVDSLHCKPVIKRTCFSVGYSSFARR